MRICWVLIGGFLGEGHMSRWCRQTSGCVWLSSGVPPVGGGETQGRPWGCAGPVGSLWSRGLPGQSCGRSSGPRLGLHCVGRGGGCSLASAEGGDLPLE